MSQFNNKVVELSLTHLKDSQDLGFLLLKHKDHGGFDALAAGEEDLASLAAMNGGAGAAASEWDSADYGRQALAYVGGGSGVVMDTANDNGTLVPDNHSFATLSESVANAAHKVGYVVVYTNHADPSDANKEVINVIEFQQPQLPTGAPFDVNFPSNGVVKMQI